MRHLSTPRHPDARRQLTLSSFKFFHGQESQLHPFYDLTLACAWLLHRFVVVFLILRYETRIP